MRAVLGRWGGFGAAAVAAVLIASAMALTLANVAGSAPSADTIVATPTHSTPGTPSASAAPTAALPVGVEQTGGLTYYTVQPFDIGRREGTLAFIASRFGTTLAQLVAWNGIADPNVIHPGQRLRVR